MVKGVLGMGKLVMPGRKRARGGVGVSFLGAGLGLRVRG